MVTKTINLFRFDELGEDAKEKVRQWYLDDPIRSDMLTEDFQNMFLDYFFPNSELKVEWSLSYCQGDGVNIFGKLRLDEVVNYIRKWKPEEHQGGHYDPTNRLSQKEIRTLGFYINQAMSTVTLPRNNRYGYCCARHMDLEDKMIACLEDWNIRDINKNLIKRFEEVCVSVIEDLCREMETMGYKYLYEVDDEEISECCDANGWYFTAAGKFEPYDGEEAV